MTTPAIRATDVIKRYGDLTAVNGVSLEVHPGEIFGIIGPNGAGKTTFMECLEGLRRPTSGTIDVLGENPSRPSTRWRERIGVQLQTAALPPQDHGQRGDGTLRLHVLRPRRPGSTP